MLLYRTVCQPQTRYLDFLADLALSAKFSGYDAAFAYATWTGVESFLDTFEGRVPSFSRAKKRWLVSIDWCRSDPLALKLLSQLNSSSVRVVNGKDLAAKPGCKPVTPFHPKALVLKGRNCIAVAAGSGNLSLNGMTKGHEVATGLLVDSARNATERELQSQCQNVADWFEAKWKVASPLQHILGDYEQTYKAVVKGQPPLTDDDVLPKNQYSRAFGRVPKLRASSKLWIQAGNLNENRGKGKPGNQLELSRMTRVFFGAPAVEVQRNSNLGEFAIRFGSFQKDCPLRFADNAMDVLTLPIPGTEGPASYDQEVLCFTRRGQKGWHRFRARARYSSESQAVEGR